MTKLILKIQKSSQKSHRRSNSEPCNPNFFHDKSKLELCFFKIIITTLVQALVGGDEITLQNLPNFDEFKPLKLVPFDKIKPLRRN